MTKEEALKLALEALDANYLLINGTETHGGLEQCLDGYYSGCFDTDSINKQTEEAITAIKEALAQSDEPFEYWNAVEGWVKLDEVEEHFDSVGCGTIYKTSGEDRVPLYTKPQIKGCAECGVNDNNHALYCVACAERYLKDKNTRVQK